MKKQFNNKKLLSIMLILSLMLSVLSQSISAADSPYLISDAEDLKNFRDLINAEASSTLSARLTADIDLNSEEWIPIYPASGYATEAFAGTFDGDGHTISGLSINSNKSNQGLFGLINGAEIKNLNVCGNVTSSNNYVGGIVGKIQQGTVSNCSFSGSVTTTKIGGYAGGISGYAGNGVSQTASISGCSNNADVNGGVIGGIAGYAKFSAITDCYNTGSVTGSGHTGGIAGQIMNNTILENCYSAAEITGGANTGGIAGWNGVTDGIRNCYWTQPDDCCKGGTGTADANCSQITSPDGLRDKLGNAFSEDISNINNGYPILNWQSGSVAEKDPKISITGNSSIYMTNSGVTPSLTLTVQYTDMDETPIEWLSDSDIITLEQPANADENNSVIIVNTVRAGTATITASTVNGEYTAEHKISVMPFITTVEISGQAAKGQTVYAKVNILGGEEYDYDNYPELSFQWRYLTEEDYSAGNTGSDYYNDIAVGRSLEVPDNLVGDYLSFSVLYNGEYITARPVKIAEDVTVPDDEKDKENLTQLNDMVAALGSYYKITPVFGTDTNVIDILTSDLTAKQADLNGVDISVKSVNEIYGGAGVDNGGNITYFYADPNTVPSVKMGSYNVTFTLTLDNVSLDLEVPVIIYWDADKVRSVMKSEILDNVTDNSILNGNTSIEKVTENLILPKVIDNKKWTQISWSSSDENIIAVSSENQSNSDTLFNPYIGVVKRGAEDKQVTLTAKFTFMLTNDINGTEKPITMNKAFIVTVKAADSEQIEAQIAELMKKLDKGFEKSGLTDAVTGDCLENNNNVYTAYNDISFPTTRDFEVDGKYYPVTITSSNPSVIKAPDVNNAARVEVYRPAAGKENASGVVSVTITDTAANISAVKSFNISVPALTQEEINSEKELMSKVKSAYFDGIKGKNTECGNITENLLPFFEVYEENGGLVWVRNNADKVNHGIVPVPLNGWEELEAWRLFKSSNPAAVTHENLLVSLQKNAKSVTINSALSSETLGKYGELYKLDPDTYADYADLADLYYQEVNADLVVRGKSTPVNTKPFAVEEKINVSFRLQSSNKTLIPDISYKNIDETTNVFDIFKKALSENGYSYDNRGSYVYSITAPDGTTIKELDEGENSGWLYKVNGKMPEVNMGACGLKDGDEIVVFFTKDYTEENGHSPSRGGGSSKNEKPLETSKPEESKPIATDTPEKKSEYTDISGHWAETAIEYISQKGLMQGVGNNCFEPDAPLTRAMFVTVLYRLENEPETKAPKFTDIKNGSWYENAIGWANENNIVYGISDTEFAPNMNITREQMAAILYRYAQIKGYDDSNNVSINYTDADTISEYSLNAVTWTSAHSIMTGNEKSEFVPRKNATRAETASVIMRMIENLNL